MKNSEECMMLLKVILDTKECHTVETSMQSETDFQKIFRTETLTGMKNQAVIKMPNNDEP